MQSPFSMVVREVAEYHDVMSLFPTAPKITIEHDPGAWSNELLPGAGMTCDVKSFYDDVVGSLEQDHPIRIALRRAINLDLTGLAHCLEVNEMIIASIAPIAENKACVRAWHYRNEITATGSIRGLL